MRCLRSRIGSPGGFSPRMAVSAMVLCTMLGFTATAWSQPCEVVDDGTGTVSLPPEGCEYLSPDEVHMIMDGLPPGTTVELGAIHLDFICRKTGGDPNHCGNPGGSLGGEAEIFDSQVILQMNGTGALAGYSRTVGMQLSCETHTGPRNPGDPVQTFPNNMFRLQGQLPPGDPDFDILQITAGNAFGLPSPGQTTLSLLPNGTWNVDSFFDITYRIDFSGAAGGPFGGMSGSTTATIRMVARGQCGPNAAGTACQPVTCPAINERCIPRCVNYDPLTGAMRVVACDCRDPNGCQPVPPAPRGADDPCVVVDDGSGTVSLPPEGCEYLSPDEVHAITNGLPPGTTIELAAIHQDFICEQAGGTPGHCGTPGGSLGGETEFFVSNLTLNVNGTGVLGGYTRQVTVPITCQTETGPRNPGDAVQVFPTEMVMLQGELFGDPDFCVLKITGGRNFGMPSPGQTTLTRLGPPGSAYQVDSFFDITYRVEFQGCPGSPLAGYQGVTVDTIKMDVAGGGLPDCAGGCPTGTVCSRQVVPRPDGTYDVCCDCVPAATEACCLPDGSCTDVDPSTCLQMGGIPQGAGSACLGDADGDGIDDACACGPTSDGQRCRNVPCPPGPVAGEQCIPRCVEFDPTTGQSHVVECDCRSPNECHAEFVAGARGGGNPCEVVDNGSGTVTLPPAGCEYLSPDEVHMILDGLPANTTLELAPIHRDFICERQPTGGACSVLIPPGLCEDTGGSLGGNVDCFTSTAAFQISGTGALAGYNRPVSIPLFAEVHTGPRNPGDAVQDFPSEMMRLQGQITGDPDFDLLRVTGGTDFGLPSPGHTTLTQLPNGNFAVDSFFDITYRIDFVGAAGGPLGGMSGSTTATIRMATGGGPSCVGACPPGTTCVESRTVTPTGTIVVCCDCVPTVTVACCLPDGTCADIDPMTCQSLGGIPQGPGSVCDADGDGVDEACLCGPRPDGARCKEVFCPDPALGERCLPRCARINSATGEAQIVACDCVSPNECHLELVSPLAGARGGSPCVVPDTGGTVTLPPQGCEYLSPDEVHLILDGLPAGTTIEFAPIHRDFICEQGGSTMPGCPPPGICEEPGGALGGHHDCFMSQLHVNVNGTGSLAGFNRILNVPLMSEVDTGPRTVGDPVQSFDNNMVRLEGELFGDPDFCVLKIRGGSANGLPSPGHTTLTQLPSGTWAVDSFFDITYQIEFQGCPGSVLQGMGGTTTGTIRMATGAGLVPRCVGACPCPRDCVQSTITNPDGTVDVCCGCRCNSTSVCPCADVDCNNIVNTLDIAIIASSANFGKPVGQAVNPRADVDGNGIINTLDIAVAASSACFGR